MTAQTPQIFARGIIVLGYFIALTRKCGYDRQLWSGQFLYHCLFGFKQCQKQNTNKTKNNNNICLYKRRFIVLSVAISGDLKTRPKVRVVSNILKNTFEPFNRIDHCFNKPRVTNEFKCDVPKYCLTCVKIWRYFMESALQCDLEPIAGCNNRRSYTKTDHERII